MYIFYIRKIRVEIMSNVTKTLPLLCISFYLADNKNIQAFVSLCIWVFKSGFSVSDC